LNWLIGYLMTHQLHRSYNTREDIKMVKCSDFSSTHGHFSMYSISSHLEVLKKILVRRASAQANTCIGYSPNTNQTMILMIEL
jgi:hypothetical protein